MNLPEFHTQHVFFASGSPDDSLLFQQAIAELPYLVHPSMAKDDEDCFDLPESSPDYGKKIAAYYFWVFPNMMFNFYPWGLSLNIVKPISQDHTKVSFFSYVWKEEKMNTGAGASLDKVELEDEEVVQNVQKGIRSSFYDHGRYSVTREQGTHHFHRLIAEFMK